jgi:hypothetical protein
MCCSSRLTKNKNLARVSSVLCSMGDKPSERRCNIFATRRSNRIGRRTIIHGNAKIAIMRKITWDIPIKHRVASLITGNETAAMYKKKHSSLRSVCRIQIKLLPWVLSIGNISYGLTLSPERFLYCTTVYFSSFNQN